MPGGVAPQGRCNMKVYYWSKMKNFLISSLTVVFCMFLWCEFQPISANAGSHDQVTVSDVIKYVQQRYDSTRDISALFTQETYSPGASQPVMAAGKVFFMRPQMMRWEYEKPDPQLIVTSGDQVYVYEKEAEQVMVLPRKRFLSSEVSRAFFFGKGSLETFFKVSTDEQCSLGKTWCLRLEPRKKTGNLKELKLIIDPETHLIQEMWISDELSSRTHIRFRDIKVNQRLSADLFKFTPPPGVEIYRAE